MRGQKKVELQLTEHRITSLHTTQWGDVEKALLNNHSASRQLLITVENSEDDIVLNTRPWDAERFGKVTQQSVPLSELVPRGLQAHLQAFDQLREAVDEVFHYPFSEDLALHIQESLEKTGFFSAREWLERSSFDCSLLAHRPLHTLFDQLIEVVQLPYAPTNLHEQSKEFEKVKNLFVEENRLRIGEMSDREIANLIRRERDKLLHPLLGSKDEQDQETWGDEWYFAKRDDIDKSMEGVVEGEGDRQFDQLVQLAGRLENMAEIAKDKLDAATRIHSACIGLASLPVAADECVEVCEKLDSHFEVLRSRCNTDLVFLHKNAQKLEKDFKSAEEHYLRNQRLSNERISSNETKQAECWQQVYALEEELQRLGQERHAEVQLRLSENDNWVGTCVEYRQFVELVGNHETLLQSTLENCDTAQRYIHMIADMGRRIYEIEAKIHSDRVFVASSGIRAATEEWEVSFMTLVDLWLDAGTKLFQHKHRYLIELEKTAGQAQAQMDFCRDTHDPNERKHYTALMVLRGLRQDAVKSLEQLHTHMHRSLQQHAPAQLPSSISMAQELLLRINHTINMYHTAPVDVGLSPVARANAYFPTTQACTVQPLWLTRSLDHLPQDLLSNLSTSLADSLTAVPIGANPNLVWDRSEDMDPEMSQVLQQTPETQEVALDQVIESPGRARSPQREKAVVTTFIRSKPPTLSVPEDWVGTSPRLPELGTTVTTTADQVKASLPSPALLPRPRSALASRKSHKLAALHQSLRSSAQPAMTPQPAALTLPPKALPSPANKYAKLYEELDKPAVLRVTAPTDDEGWHMSPILGSSRPLTSLKFMSRPSSAKAGPQGHVRIA
eukprot:TRINITY_DN3898_c0_g1_i1.p1 TRINITY_DN3898_c0_g1~~TRINITY_DN3898_c0_g1_i1.p1  ORF type:complete len:843 (-),score=121.85 TRINITY_DN3898_c0_g1_i1:23-2551(-)